jgi:hypothetical protein
MPPTQLRCLSRWRFLRRERRQDPSKFANILPILPAQQLTPSIVSKGHLLGMLPGEYARGWLHGLQVCPPPLRTGFS